MAQNSDEITDLTAQIAALRAEVVKLNNHRFLRVQNSPWRLILQRFAMGLAVGLGSVVGASFLVSVLVYFLSQIDFLPIVGDWAKAIVTDIQASHPTSELPIGQGSGMSDAATPAPDTGPHPP
jgi:hypothetical protein